MPEQRGAVLPRRCAAPRARQHRLSRRPAGRERWLAAIAGEVQARRRAVRARDKDSGRWCRGGCGWRWGSGWGQRPVEEITYSVSFSVPTSPSGIHLGASMVLEDERMEVGLGMGRRLASRAVAASVSLAATAPSQTAAQSTPPVHAHRPFPRCPR
uniref:Uncharacterized protein n=1 Tax=Oryza barthii TaxID=65489 RepID=A0A0D3HVD6_9ORYZ